MSLDVNILRPLVLMLPALLLIFVFGVLRRSTLERAAAFLAYVWQFQTRLILNVAALQSGAWQFNIDGGQVFGVPVDITMGYAILFGPVVALAGLASRPLIVACAAAAFECLLMYSMPAIYSPGHYWVGAVVAVNFIAVIPSLFLANATATDTHLHLRAAIQTVGWVCLLGWLFPSLLFANGFGTWNVLLAAPLERGILGAALLCVPVWILGSALYEFAVKGEGTAFPYDPPKRLVTTGVYSYVSNPMQLGVCLLMACWGLVLGSVHVSLSALAAVMLFIVFKNVCNGSSSVGNRNPMWGTYTRQVPKWLPRRTPWRLPRSGGEQIATSQDEFASIRL